MTSGGEKARLPFRARVRTPRARGRILQAHRQFIVRLFGLLVLDEFDGAEETLAAHIADVTEFAQLGQPASQPFAHLC